jgi:hypothetical protein
MNCSAARNWLLMADDVSRPTAEVSEHLAGCAACQKLAGELTTIELAVRAVPTPQIAIAGRDAFLSRIAPTPRPRRRRGGRRITAAFAVLAASLVIGIGLAAWMQPRPKDNGHGQQSIAQTKPVVVEELVEWNLKLTEAEVPTERQQLVRERLPQLQAKLQSSNLSTEDRAFAEQLLVHAQRMGEAADPVEEAEAFHGLADTLLVRLDTMVDDPDRSEFYAKLYSQVRDRGVDANLDRAQRLAHKADKQARVEKLQTARNRQEAKAVALAARMHEKAREHIKPARPKAKGSKK